MDEETDWVVLTFSGAEDAFPVGWMDALLPLEEAAIDALAESGTGDIDGNEIGEHGYELYFVGEDRHAVWATIEPIFRDSPVPWSKVELRSSLEDSDPIVLLPEH